MKVLLINGGPHKDGATNRALLEVAGAINAAGLTSEIIWLGRKPYSGCQGCGACAKLGKCAYDDDLVNQIAGRLAEFSGFVFGSPVHYAAASGTITSFLDRLFYSSAKALFAGKAGAAIVSARRAGTTAAIDQLNKYFPINGMITVGSQYWPMVHGNTAEEVEQDLEGLQIMRTLGRELAWILKCIAAGKAAGIEPPVPEKPQKTNFIR